jgi:hypothetical protein
LRIKSDTVCSTKPPPSFSSESNSFNGAFRAAKRLVFLCEQSTYSIAMVLQSKQNLTVQSLELKEKLENTKQMAQQIRERTCTKIEEMTNRLVWLRELRAMLGSPKCQIRCRNSVLQRQIPITFLSPIWWNSWYHKLKKKVINLLDGFCQILH